MRRASIDLGDVSVSRIDDGSFYLDGGAMFGAVPKPVWEKQALPDALNRVELACSVALVRSRDRLVLIDTGCGDKWDDKFRNIYSIGQARILAALAALGVEPSRVTDVVLSHLHFDHAGGVARRLESDPAAGLLLNYPNARHYVQRIEWMDALAPTELTRRSYLPENFLLLSDSGNLVLLDGETEIIPGITLFPAAGHTMGHQAVKIQGDSDAMYFLGDIVPSTRHLRLPWLTAFDLDRSATLEAKRSCLNRILAENALLWLYHDTLDTVVRLSAAENSVFGFSPVLSREVP